MLKRPSLPRLACLALAGALLLAVTPGARAQAQARAQAGPAPAALIAACDKYPLGEVAAALQEAASCRSARDIYVACAAPGQYHLNSELIHAFQERCERDFEGRLQAAAQRRLVREQARCTQGAEDDRGIIGNFAERVIRDCQARVAAKFAIALSQGKPAGGPPPR